jgi:hypothetical protein
MKHNQGYYRHLQFILQHSIPENGKDASYLEEKNQGTTKMEHLYFFCFCFTLRLRMYCLHQPSAAVQKAATTSLSQSPYFHLH